MTIRLFLAALWTASATVAVACGTGGNPGHAPAGLIRIDGSSTIYPIAEAVAEEFQKKNPDVSVTVGISGTGGGFQRFCRGESDITNASRPIQQIEAEACETAGINELEAHYVPAMPEASRRSHERTGRDATLRWIGTARHLRRAIVLTTILGPCRAQGPGGAP